MRPIRSSFFGIDMLAGRIDHRLVPDTHHHVGHFSLLQTIGSLVASMSLTSKEVGLTDFPSWDRPSVLIPFFAFRIMVGCGLILMALAWFGSYVSFNNRLEQNRLLVWCLFSAFRSRGSRFCRDGSRPKWGVSHGRCTESCGRPTR